CCVAMSDAGPAGESVPSVRLSGSPGLITVFLVCREPVHERRAISVQRPVAPRRLGADDRLLILSRDPPTALLGDPRTRTKPPVSTGVRVRLRMGSGAAEAGDHEARLCAPVAGRAGDTRHPAPPPARR